jgi:hypothetical protein
VRTAAEAQRRSVDWRRAEFLLTLLAFAGFITLPIRITTIYSGLPAHPLFVHVPVILIPVSVLTAILFALRAELLARYGAALALVSIVAMSSIFLAMQAGGALRGELNLQGSAAKLIAEHSQAAHILAIVYVAFTATLILAFSAKRISDGMPTGLVLIDRPLASRGLAGGLRIALVLLALVAGYMCFRTGDLGAKAVWQGRLQSASGTHGRFPGPPPGTASP